MKMLHEKMKKDQEMGNKNICDEIMETYVKTMSKAPEECQECTRRHFMGCNGCPNKQYWDNLNLATTEDGCHSECA